MQDRSGQTLGNYKLIRLLGRGGYAEAYLGEHIYLEFQTAIKVLRSRKLSAEEQTSFHEEAKFISTLQHPHIVRILDYGIEMDEAGTSLPYIVMEYAPHGTMRNLYPTGKCVSQEQIGVFVKQMAEALQFAHNNQRMVVHCDVKPENMLVRKLDDLALSDFGIATSGLYTGNLQQQKLLIMQKMANHEVEDVPGTAAYIAPERLEGHIQRASDQYALAIVTYEWLCGHRPFSGSNIEICNKQKDMPPPSLHAAFSQISLSVERVVMKGLAKDPKDRFASIIDYALALEEAIKEANKVISPPTPIRPPTVSLPLQGGVTPVKPPTRPASIPNNLPPPSLPSVYNNPNTQQRVYLPPTRSADQASSYTATTNAGFTVSNTVPPSGISSNETTAQSLSQYISTAQTALRVDPYFLKKPQNRLFLIVGNTTNVIAALLLLLMPPILGNMSTALIAVIGGTLSIIFLRQCAISLKKYTARWFGAGVALWWGYVVGTLLSLVHSPALSTLGFIVGFMISLFIHLRFIERKLMN